jgi:hypothetical protein
MAHGHEPADPRFRSFRQLADPLRIAPISLALAPVRDTIAEQPLDPSPSPSVSASFA